MTNDTWRVILGSITIATMAFIALLCIYTAPKARSADWSVPSITMGDSIGLQLALARHLPTTAVVGMHIRDRRVLSQFSHAPRGSFVLIALGTNDAAGDTRDLGPSVLAIIEASRDRDLSMVWLGPVCPSRQLGWNERAALLDASLANTLSPYHGIRYVSLHSPELCSALSHAPDGYHFSNLGLARAWRKAFPRGL